MSGITHAWKRIVATSRSGKTLWECSFCGLRSPGPVKAQYENRRCRKGRWEDTYRQADGSDFPSIWNQP